MTMGRLLFILSVLCMECTSEKPARHHIKAPRYDTMSISEINAHLDSLAAEGGILACKRL